ncbi:PAS domain-containing protein [Anaerolineales bacterium HSG24]|nr:PAS domain-containing protein [Anaerolineales bacterium HSG24]
MKQDLQTTYQALVEQIPVITYIAELGEHNTLRYISPQVKSLLGYEPQLDITSWRSWIFSDDYPAIRQALQQSQNTGAPFQAEYRVRHADGRLLWLLDRATVVPDTNQHGFLLHGVMFDITHRKKLEKALLQRNQELSLLNQVSQKFITTFNLEQILYEILEDVCRFLEVSIYTIWLIEPNTGELFCWQAVDNRQNQFADWKLALGEGLVGWVAEHNQPVIIANTATDDRYQPQFNQTLGLTVRSMLSVPLQRKQVDDSEETLPQVLGVLQLMDSHVNHFNETDLRLIEPLAVTIAIAIENNRLYEQVRQDAETRAALLDEMDHQVKNNLSAIIGLLYSEQGKAHEDNRDVYQDVLRNLISRIHGLAAVHSLLSASVWQPIRIYDIIERIIYSTIQAFASGHNITVTITPSTALITADQAHNLALVVNELTIFFLKQAELSNPVKTELAIYIVTDAQTIGFDYRVNMNLTSTAPFNSFNPFNLIANLKQSTAFQQIKRVIEKNLQGTISLHQQQSMVIEIRFKQEAS